MPRQSDRDRRKDRQARAAELAALTHPTEIDRLEAEQIADDLQTDAAPSEFSHAWPHRSRNEVLSFDGSLPEAAGAPDDIDVPATRNGRPIIPKSLAC